MQVKGCIALYTVPAADEPKQQGNSAQSILLHALPCTDERCICRWDQTASYDGIQQRVPCMPICATCWGGVSNVPYGCSTDGGGLVLLQELFHIVPQLLVLV